MTAPLIEAKALAIGYPRKPVASGIDLAVRPGEVLCLLGPNGAGKTTLFRTLLGLIPPQGGSVLLGSRDLAALSRREIALSVAYVPQAQVTEFAYTVFDLVLMGRTAHLGPFAAPSRQDRSRSMEALGALGIAELASADCTRISGGQRQLALIARALAQDSRAIILDEPTASLDLGNRAKVLERVSALAASGLAVVLSTHEPDQAFELASSVAILAEGGFLASGPAREVLSEETLTKAYGVPVRIETTGSGSHVTTARRSQRGLRPHPVL